METRLYFARIEDLLLPIYRGKVPMAATYLDDRIQSGILPLADGDEPSATVSVMPVAELGEQLGLEEEEGDGHQEVCPRLNCTAGAHVFAEHRVWVHLHHLHAAGLLLVNEHDAIRFASPPGSPGAEWQFVSGFLGRRSDL